MNDTRVRCHPEEVEAATIVRERLAPNRREELGPFDLIGDVHGCRAELEALRRAVWSRWPRA